MDESTQDPAITAEVTPDNPALDHDAPVEQGQGAEHEASGFDAPEDDGGSLRHADYTRKTQALAEERKAFETERQQYQQAVQLFEALQQDPETTLQELQELLLEQEGAGEYDEYEDADNPQLAELQDRLDRLEAEKQAEQVAQHAVQRMSSDVDEINKIRQQQGEEPLSHKELERIAQFSAPDQNGVRPLLDTYKALNGWFEERQQRYVAGKRAPAPPGAGQQGSEKFDINDRDSRIKRLKAVLDGSQ